MKTGDQTELTSIKADDNNNDLLIEGLPTQDSISPWSLMKSLSAVVFSKKNRPRIIGATILSAAHTGITLLSSYLLSKIIQNVTTPDQPTEILGREFSSGELLVLLMISNFLSNQLPDTRDQLMAKVTANNTSTLIKETTEHVLLQSLSHHLTAQPSDHAFLIQKGFVVPPAVTLFLTAVFPRVLQVLMATIFLSVEYDPYIGISLPTLLLLQLLYCRLAARFILDVNLKLITTGNDVWGGFIGAVANYKIVHDYQKLEDTIGKLKVILHAWNNAFTQSIMKPLLIGYGQNILSYGHCGLASYYMIYNLNERFTPHDFVIIFSYLLQQAILSPQFAQAVIQLISVYPDIAFLFKELAHPPGIIDLHPNIPFPKRIDAPPSIEFKDVEFGYPPKKIGETVNPTFNKLSIKFAPGKTVALVSRSGAGKTTLFNLLRNSFKPQKGSILINDQDISTFSLKALQEQVTLVRQDPNLFNDSVGNNIRYGAPHPDQISDEDIFNLARRVKLDVFLNGLTDKLETNVGESGKKLSGGEQQRVAILRGLMKPCSILLLDEITAALDANTAQQVLGAILSEFKDITCLMITHKLTEASLADEIVVIENGAVAAQGTHDELLNSCSLYQELWRAQHKTSTQETRGLSFFKLAGATTHERDHVFNKGKSFAPIYV